MSEWIIPPLTLCLGAGLVVTLFVVARAVTVVPVGHAGLVERLGKFQRVLDPGTNVVFPFVDRVVKISTGERKTTFRTEPVRSTDGRLVQTVVSVVYDVADPARARYGVGDISKAIERLAFDVDRTVVARMDTTAALSGSERIRRQIQIALNANAPTWGIRIREVAVPDIRGI